MKNAPLRKNKGAFCDLPNSVLIYQKRLYSIDNLSDVIYSFHSYHLQLQLVEYRDNQKKRASRYIELLEGA